jgi:formylglycine-generating enzyme required for sulfatase activity
LDAIAWWKNNSVRSTHPVAGKTKNKFGLHDMIGNVSEWCADLSNSYPVDYQNSQELNPTGPTTGSYRVIRGGSFSSPQNELRAAYRSSLLPNKRSAAIGFRPVLAAE